MPPTENYDDKRESEKETVDQKKRHKESGFDRLLQSFDLASRQMPKWQIDEIRAVITKNYKKRFEHSRVPKYGTINKGFTELELQHFLRNAPNEKFRLLFKYQAFLGLRVGEVCKLHLGNIDFGNLDKRELVLKTEKAQKTDALRIPQELFIETIEFINKNADNIKMAHGFIFFKDEHGHKVNGYIEPDYVRRVFRDTARLTGLDAAYGTSDETDTTRRTRRLHRLTTHSLRHYAITHFAKSTNGNIVLASRFARHANPATTMRYIARDNEELYRSIDFAFDFAKLDNIHKLVSISRNKLV